MPLAGFPFRSEAVGKDARVTQILKQWFDRLVLLVNGPAESYTFATLPVQTAPGKVYVVTDSTVAAWGAVIAGGGANTVLAWWNGTAWTVVGV